MYDNACMYCISACACFLCAHAHTSVHACISAHVNISACVYISVQISACVCIRANAY